jgi:hypothetical protein
VSERVAVQDLPVGRTVVGHGVVERVTSVEGLIEVAYADGMPLLYPPEHEVELVPVDPRDAVVAAARALVASWGGPYPAGIDPEAVIGGCEGDLDDALARLDAAQHSRSDAPEQPPSSCPAGWPCDGRRGEPLVPRCEQCSHYAHHGDGGCVAQTFTGRCGCTGGGA